MKDKYQPDVASPQPHTHQAKLLIVVCTDISAGPSHVLILQSIEVLVVSQTHLTYSCSFAFTQVLSSRISLPSPST